MLEFFEKPEAEVLGKTDKELLPSDAYSICAPTDKAILEGVPSFLGEENLSNRIFDVLKFPVRLASGNTGIGGFIRDIAVRKKAEIEILRHSRFQQLVNNFSTEFVNTNAANVNNLVHTMLSEAGASTFLIHPYVSANSG